MKQANDMKTIDAFANEVRRGRPIGSKKPDSKSGAQRQAERRARQAAQLEQLKTDLEQSQKKIAALREELKKERRFSAIDVKVCERLRLENEGLEAENRRMAVALKKKHLLNCMCTGLENAIVRRRGES